jgi:hypothetical protein
LNRRAYIGFWQIVFSNSGFRNREHIRGQIRHQATIAEQSRFIDGLTQHQRDNWNSPTSICNRCPALLKVQELLTKYLRSNNRVHVIDRTTMK